MFFYPVPFRAYKKATTTSDGRRSPLEFSLFDNQYANKLLRHYREKFGGGSLPPIREQSFANILSRYSLGYSKEFPPSPFQPILWQEEENEALHEWSFEKQLYDYGYYKLEKIFKSPMDYLNTRVDIVTLIKKYVNMGANRRLIDEKNAEMSKRDKGDVKVDDVIKQIESGEF